MSPTLTIVQENDRFKILENGEPLQVTRKNGKVVVVEFENREIAEDYIRALSDRDGVGRSQTITATIRSLDHVLAVRNLRRIVSCSPSRALWIISRKPGFEPEKLRKARFNCFTVSLTL